MGTACVHTEKNILVLEMFAPFCQNFRWEMKFERIHSIAMNSFGFVFSKTIDDQ